MKKTTHFLTLIVANYYGMQKYSSFKVCLLTSQLLSTERGQMMRVVLAFKSSGLSVMEDSATAHVKKKKKISPNQILNDCPSSISLNRNRNIKHSIKMHCWNSL